MNNVQVKANVKAKATSTTKSASWFKPQYLLMDWFHLSNHLKEQSDQSNIDFKINPYFQELLAQKSNAVEHLENFQCQNQNPSEDCIKSDLLEQSRLDSNNDSSDLSLIANIVEYLDHKGYMTEDIYTSFCLDFSVNSFKLDTLLNRIKSYEPQGFGSKGLKDFFLYSVKQSGEPLKLEKVLENNDFLNIATQVEQIADRYDYDEICQLQDELSTLFELTQKRQYPAYNLTFSTNTQKTRLADFKIQLKENNSFEVHSYLSDIDVPIELSTDQIYLKQIEKRIQLGPLLIQELLNYQESYLFNPEPYELKPLTRTQFYKKIQSNPVFKENLPYSTMCLILQDKVLSTSNGDYYKISHFFTKKLSEQAGDVSRDHVMDVIQSIISHEKGDNPYSDEEIVQNIQTIMDISIARKTIEKYRNLLLIPSKVIRKFQFNLRKSLKLKGLESKDYNAITFLINLFPNQKNIHHFKEYLIKQLVKYLTEENNSFVDNQQLFNILKTQGKIRISEKLINRLREEILIDYIRPKLEFNSTCTVIPQAHLINEIQIQATNYLQKVPNNSQTEELLQKHLIPSEDCRQMFVVLRHISQSITTSEKLRSQSHHKKLKQIISKILKNPIKSSNYRHLEDQNLNILLEHISAAVNHDKFVISLAIYNNTSTVHLKKHLLDSYTTLKDQQ